MKRQIIKSIVVFLMAGIGAVLVGDINTVFGIFFMLWANNLDQRG